MTMNFLHRLKNPKKSKITNTVILAPIPALLVGAIVMSSNKISPFVYGQNLICYLILGSFLHFFSAKSVRIRYSKVGIMMPILCCIAVACTFFDSGLENVHRWLTFGSFRFYISSIVLPCLIIHLGVLMQKESVVFPVAIAALVILMLTLQPDASQTSAFAVSIAFLVWIQTKNRLLKYGIALWSIGFIVFSWIHIDGLVAVAHVEDILFLAKDMGIAWFVLGIVSLGLLLVPFLCFSHAPKLARSVGLYYIVTLASSFFGNFPVMFMGFGISPIIGYQLAMFLLLRENLYVRHEHISG